MRRIVLLAAVLLLTSACYRVPLPGLGGAPGPALERKVVSHKREPAELVAPDGSSCFTSQRRWSVIRPGARVWCVWAWSGDYAGGPVNHFPTAERLAGRGLGGGDPR
ncbi:MAG TPA: hypothetical protein VFX98_02455 [Longimicrobiaceae bacterium]|nr:hypothetical protein [Longimicrobiaceae bacterium]